LSYHKQGASDTVGI